MILKALYPPFLMNQLLQSLIALISPCGHFSSLHHFLTFCSVFVFPLVPPAVKTLLGPPTKASTITTAPCGPGPPHLPQEDPASFNSRSLAHYVIAFDPTWALISASERALKLRHFEPPSALIGALESLLRLPQFSEFSLFLSFISHPFLDQFP